MTTLVLLHAFPLDSGMWEPMRAELPDDLEVLAPDLCGFGRSALPEAAPGAEPDLGAAADDVIALLDERGLDQVVLAGCSMGGYVAMAVLRKVPRRVAGLVLIDTRAGADDAERRNTRLSGAQRTEAEGTGWLADTMLPGLLAAGAPDTRHELVGWLRARIGAQPAPAVAWAQRAIAARPDSTDVLRAYQGPALVVVGERDALAPPEVARAMADLMPDSRFVEVPGHGHLTPLEAPAEVAAAIVEWLPALDGRGAGA